MPWLNGFVHIAERWEKLLDHEIFREIFRRKYFKNGNSGPWGQYYDF
jgi:hypothetical protein